MKNHGVLSFLLCLGVIALLSNVVAQIPNSLQYEGRLAASGSGEAISSTLPFVFSIFTEASGGSSIWTETHPAVSVQNGFFTVELGGIYSLSGLSFDAPYYLEITVNGETLSPRMPFSPAPYAFRAASVESGSVHAESLSGDVIGSGGGLRQTAAGALAVAEDSVTSGMIQDGTIQDSDISGASSIILANASQILTQKQIDASVNSLSNLAVTQFAADQIVSDLTSLSVAGSGQLATAQAVKSYVDDGQVTALDDLQDTAVSTPLGGEILAWDPIAGVWLNETLTGDVTLSFNDGILNSSLAPGSVEFASLSSSLTAGDAAAVETADSSVLTTAAGVVDFVDLEFREFSWQRAVLGFWDPGTELPSSPGDGDRYIASGSGNDWQMNSIYEYVTDLPGGAMWVQTPPASGMTCWVSLPSPGRSYTYTGMDWKTSDPFDVTEENVAFRGNLSADGDVALGNAATDVVNILGQTTLEAGVQFAGLGTVSPGMVLAAVDSQGTVGWLELQPSSVTNGSGTSLASISGPADSGAALIGVYDGFTHASGSNVQEILTGFDSSITAAGTPQSAVLSVSTPDGSLMTATTPDETLEFIEGPGIKISGTNPQRADFPLQVTVGLSSSSFTLTAGAGLAGGGSASLGGSVDLSLDPSVAGEGLGFDTGIVSINSGDGLAVVGDALQIKVNSGILTFGDSHELTLATNIDGVSLGFDADKVDGRNVDDAEETDQFLWTAAKIQSHVNDALVAYGPSTEELNWRRSVEQFWDPETEGKVPTGYPAGARFVALSPWDQDGVTWIAGCIYEWDGMGWLEYIPNQGFVVYSMMDGSFWVFNGGGWSFLESMFSHDNLAGIQGGGWNAATEISEYYHLRKAQADVLEEIESVPQGRLLALVDSTGSSRIREAELTAWLQAGTNISVHAEANGGATISVTGLGSGDTPSFSGLVLGSAGLNLNGTSVKNITVDSAALEAYPANLVTAGAVSGYVNGKVQNLSLADLDDVLDYGTLSGGELLTYDMAAEQWAVVSTMPVDAIPLATDGGLMKSGGLGVQADGSSIVVGTQGIKVGVDPNGSLEIVAGEGLDIKDHSIDAFHLVGLSDAGLSGQILGTDGTGGFVWNDGSPLTRSETQPTQTTWEYNGEGVGSSGMAGAAVDASGYLYVADSQANQILLFDPSLQIVSYLGGGAQTWVSGAPSEESESGTDAGYFMGPTDVAVDTSSSPALLYVADADNGRVVKIDLATGAFLASNIGVDYNVPGLMGFYPQGLDVDGTGMLYVADAENSIIQVFNSYGNLVAWYGKGETFSGCHASTDTLPTTSAGSGEAEFNEPTDVAISSDGTVLVTDSVNGNVQVFQPYSAALTNGDGGDFIRQWSEDVPVNIDVASGTVAVASVSRYVVRLYDLEGNLIQTLGTLDTEGTGSGEFTLPLGLAFSGNELFAIDAGRVQRFLAPSSSQTYYSLGTEGSALVIGGNCLSESAAFQVDSTTGGILIPRLSWNEKLAIQDPENGLLVFQTDGDSGFQYYDASTMTWRSLAAEEDVLKLTGGTVSGDLTVEGNTALGISEDNTVAINGGLTIASGTPGEGKVLTSDINGKASWQSPGDPNIITVSAGESIQAAIDKAAGRTGDSVLIRVGPGVFSEKITLGYNVTVAGAGAGLTVIRSNGGSGRDGAPVETDATVTISGVTNAGLRNLSVESIQGTSGTALGIFLMGAANDVHLSDIEVKAQGNTGIDQAVGIYVKSSYDPEIQNLSVKATGSPTDRCVGIWAVDGHIQLDRVYATAEASTGTEIGIFGEDCTLSVTNSRVVMSGTAPTVVYGILNGGDSSALESVFHRVDIKFDISYASEAAAFRQELGSARVYHSTLSVPNSGYGFSLAPSTNVTAYYTTVSAYTGMAELVDQTAVIRWRQCWDEQTDTVLDNAPPTR